MSAIIIMVYITSPRLSDFLIRSLYLFTHLALILNLIDFYWQLIGDFYKQKVHYKNTCHVESKGQNNQTKQKQTHGYSE